MLSCLCPFCSYPLLRQVQSSRLIWYCSRCRQATPYGIEASGSTLSTDNYQLANVLTGTMTDTPSQPLSSEQLRRQLEWEQQQHKQQQAKEYDRLAQLKQDFLATVSHELTTPLSTIKMGLQVLEHFLHNRELTALDIDRYMTMMNHACDQELQMVNDILLIQQIRANTYPLTPTIVPLQSWLPHLTESFEATTQPKQTILKPIIPKHLPTLKTDLTILTRILKELLTNACKFSPPDGQIAVTVQTRLGQLEISVSNSNGSNPGEGELGDSTDYSPKPSNSALIPPSELPHIFDPFHRVPNTDPWQHGGMGLGLSLAQTLTTVLNGSLWVKSTEQQTCFTLGLPCQDKETGPDATDMLLSYVAYYVSRGREVLNPAGEPIPFTGAMYNYWGYHPDFLTQWYQLQQQPRFNDCYLSGDTYSFGDMLQGHCTVMTCARCNIPVPVQQGGGHVEQQCYCERTLMPELEVSLGVDLANVERSDFARQTITEGEIVGTTGSTPTQVLVVGPPPLENWHSLFRLNGLNVTFIPQIDQLVAQDNLPRIDLVLLTAVSVQDSQAVVHALRCYAQTQYAAIVALSPEARLCQPWAEQSSTVQDYLLTPHSGDYLAQYLQNRHANNSQTSDDPHWFPG